MKAGPESKWPDPSFWGADGYWNWNVNFGRNLWPLGWPAFDNSVGLFREDYVTVADGGFWGGVIA